MVITNRELANQMKNGWKGKVLRYFQSSTYRVSFYIQPKHTYENGFETPLMGLLSYRRKDGNPIVCWREKQLIKDCISGTETEAVEIFPHWERLLDSANQYHLWLMPYGNIIPFGYFGERCTEQDPFLKKALRESLAKNFTPTPQEPRLSRHNYIEDAGFGPLGLLGAWWRDIKEETENN